MYKGSKNQKSVQFFKKSLIEIIFINIRRGVEEAFYQEFLDQFSEILKNLGGELILKLKVSRTSKGPYHPDVILFVDWVSKNKFKEHKKSLVFKEFEEKMIAYISFMKRNNLMSVGDDLLTEFSKDKMYEFNACWFDERRLDQVSKYIEGVKPLIERFGCKEVLDLKVSDAKSDYNPQYIKIKQWPSSLKFDDLESMNHYKPFQHYKNVCMVREDSFHTHVLV